jgi:predicted  nucleic acid-binding Zn-ribbon protein
MHWHTHIDGLDSIERQLRQIRKDMHNMSTQMDELNTAIQNLVADATANADAVTALIAKIDAVGVTADLSDEIQAVKDASASLEASKEAADAVLNPPAAPADPATDPNAPEVNPL